MNIVRPKKSLETREAVDLLNGEKRSNWVKKYFKKIYDYWMLFAKALGWVNTRILLSLMYFVIFTPFRIISVVIGKDMLDRKIEKNRESYWQKKDIKPFKKELYGRQF